MQLADHCVTTLPCKILIVTLPCFYMFTTISRLFDTSEHEKVVTKILQGSVVHKPCQMG